jgi:GntP family gluconate:H+ symporter
VQELVPSAGTGISLLFVAFAMTMVVRVAQGSATVAMITGAGIVAPIAAATVLPYHPLYLALAVGCGSKPLPWMNDSGFWVVGRMSGMTPAETLRTFSTGLTVMGVAGFLVVVAGALLIPLA